MEFDSYEGLATRFADPADLQRYQDAKARGASEEQALRVGDNGIGASDLGGISTPNTYGIAVPRSYLTEHFGNDPADWRKARATITYGDQQVQVPFVDLGPGQKPQARGVVTDLTDPLARALGTGDEAPVKLGFRANAGPDYNANPEAFQKEQNDILTNLAGQARGSMVSDTDALNDAIRRQTTAQSLLGFA
jgi:hypothetical protein